MRKITIILFCLFALMIFIQSCFVLNDTKKEKDGICDIHNVKMRKAFVKAVYGLRPIKNFDVAYPNAKRPFLMGCSVRHPRRIFAIVYYCKECDKLAKQANKKEKSVNKIY
jgi:hypothetical protein